MNPSLVQNVAACRKMFMQFVQQGAPEDRFSFLKGWQSISFISILSPKDIKWRWIQYQKTEPNLSFIFWLVLVPCLWALSFCVFAEWVQKCHSSTDVTSSTTYRKHARLHYFHNLFFKFSISLLGIIPPKVMQGHQPKCWDWLKVQTRTLLIYIYVSDSSSQTLFSVHI